MDSLVRVEFGKMRDWPASYCIIGFAIHMGRPCCIILLGQIVLFALDDVEYGLLALDFAFPFPRFFFDVVSQVKGHLWKA